MRGKKTPGGHIGLPGCHLGGAWTALSVSGCTRLEGSYQERVCGSSVQAQEEEPAIPHNQPP